MAEFTGIPYWEIVKAAAIPALLYFTGIALMTHFEAKRLGLKGLKKEELPAPKDVLKRIYLLIPIVVMIVFLASGTSAMRAALYGVFATILIGVLQPGENRLTVKRLFEALAAGARTALGVAAACASAGMIVGVITAHRSRTEIWHWSGRYGRRKCDAHPGADDDFQSDTGDGHSHNSQLYHHLHCRRAGVGPVGLSAFGGPYVCLLLRDCCRHYAAGGLGCLCSFGNQQGESRKPVCNPHAWRLRHL